LTNHVKPEMLSILMGRPSKYTQALADEICERLSKGEPLASICRDEKMPEVRTVSDWKTAHPEFSADFNQPNYEAFVEAEIAAGSITAPGWSIPRIRAAWCSSNWIGLPMPSLNPLQETKAALERVSGGLSNRELESGRMTATTFADNIDRITQENAALALANESIGVQNTGYQLGREPVPGAESAAVVDDNSDDNPGAEPDAE